MKRIEWQTEVKTRDGHGMQLNLLEDGSLVILTSDGDEATVEFDEAEQLFDNMNGLYGALLAKKDITT